MFKVPDGGKIEIHQTGVMSNAGRVWLDLPLDTPAHNLGYNLIEVSVRLEDLEAAISRYKIARAEKEASHA